MIVNTRNATTTIDFVIVSNSFNTCSDSRMGLHSSIRIIIDVATTRILSSMDCVHTLNAISIMNNIACTKCVNNNNCT